MKNKKNIIVTGASKGVGLKITSTLLKENCRVYAISRTKSDELIKISQKYKDDLEIIQYDLSDINNIDKVLFKDSIGFKNKIHGIVNNAAIAYDDIITNADCNELLKSYTLNVMSPIMLSKYVIRHFLLHRIKGSIIFISSISAHTGYKGLSMYASTKGALESFSKNCAREWGPRGIRSNCVVPGFMETAMSSSLTIDQKNRIYNRTCLKDATSINSVSNTVSFLLSDNSCSITGQNIFVDNGTI